MERRAGLVSDGGVPVTLVGTPIASGDRAPDFACVRAVAGGYVLEVVHLADTSGARVFSAVPSIDTPVCAIQAVRFARAVAELGPQAQSYTVSVDTPWAAQRFCATEEGVRGGVLSDYRPERSFGRAFGVLVDETGELARAVFVVDAAGVVRHVELVADTDLHPDYDAALAALRGALDAG